jgi:hypothetical protein
MFNCYDLALLRDVNRALRTRHVAVWHTDMLGTGPGGWRPADRWLRETYPVIRNSVMPLNGLAGSMSLRRRLRFRDE